MNINFILYNSNKLKRNLRNDLPVIEKKNKILQNELNYRGKNTYTLKMT